MFLLRISKNFSQVCRPSSSLGACNAHAMGGHSTGHSGRAERALGGGGGSAANATALLGSNGAGGGGGGGQVNIKTLTYTSNVENISITVGGGGNGATFPQFFSNLSPGGVHTYSGSDGESSSIGTITSNGGKGGKSSMASVGAGGAFQSGGNSSGYNGGVTTYNGGTGWASSDAVAGGGAGTKAIGGDYDNGGTSGDPPQGPAGDGGAGVNTTNTPEIDTAWENILNAISLPVGAGGHSPLKVRIENVGTRKVNVVPWIMGNTRRMDNEQQETTLS